MIYQVKIIMNDTQKLTPIAILPGKDGMWRPCPELLTPEEAIQFLRLDIDGPGNPLKTLEYYRNKKLLQATRVGRKLFYMRSELMKFLELLTARTS